MHQLRLAVVGAGLIGRSHIERIKLSPECRLAAIADPSPQAAAYAGELGAPHYADLVAMLEAERPDGVIVATPNASHAANTLACIERRIPVLIEKPITHTVEDAERIIAAAGEAGLAVLVGHHRRHNPILGHARDMIRGGRLGCIATVAAFETFLKPDDYFDVAWRREPGGGPVLINLVHAIDDLRFLCGEIAAVQALTSNALRGFPVEDTAVVNLRFVSGALGTVTLSDTAAAPWSWELTAAENPVFPPTGEDCYFITGTEGALVLPSMRLWRYGKSRTWTAPLAMERLEVEPADPLARQLAHFCAMVRGEAAPMVTGRDAARTLAAVLAILDASGSDMTINSAA
jgi:predicted dehydrogenase